MRATEHRHNHNHHSHGLAVGAKLAWAIGLTLAFVIGEIIAGYFSHSLALLSDAGHNFADAAALGFSWYAVWIAQRPSNASMTYGYHRVGILAALVNAFSLALIALIIVWEAVHRLWHPEAIHGWLMVIVAAIAIGVNALIGFWLHAGSRHDINLRSAYLHMLGDAISACGVVLAGLLVIFTGSPIADPIVSCLIAALILWSSWGVLSESITVLLEGTPRGIDMSGVVATIRNISGVLNVHDLHVWTLGPGAVACSCHVIVPEQTIREGEQTIKKVVAALARNHKINHTTVQIEVEGHPANEMYCCIQSSVIVFCRH